MTESRTRTDPNLGRLVDGRFRLDRLLGEGGMGKVYAGTQISVEREVAIKLLRQDLSGLETLEQRFFREAKTLAQLRHPNIVGIVDFGRDESLDALYFAMEYIDGRSLADLLKQGRLPLELALNVTRQLCSGLSEAHAAGIVHRDLKPDNVMMSLTAEGKLTARLLDFGIALPTGDETRFTSTGAVVGTPHYMSPEQAQDRPVDARSDLYSLGVMLFQMLTGQLPFVAETPMAVLLKAVTQAPPRVEELLDADDVPPQAVIDLLYSTLSKEPADRPASASEMGAALDGLLHGSAVPSVEFGSLTELSDAVIAHASEEFFAADTAAPGAVAPQTPSVPTRSTDPAELRSGAESAPALEPPSPAPSAERSSDEDKPEAPSAAPTPPTPPSRAVHPLVLIAGIVGLLALVLLSVVAVFWLDRRSASDVVVHSESGTTRVEARVDGRAALQPQTGAAAIPSGPSAPLAVADKPSETESPVASKAPVKPAAPERSERVERVPAPVEKPPVEEPKGEVAETESEASAPSGARSPVRREFVPPTDDATLRAKVLTEGGWCPKDQDCNFAPTVQSAVCAGESDCSHSCEGNPGCTQACKNEGTCIYACPRGKCLQDCSDQADCKLSCSGGGCTQFCHDQAYCKVSCSGGGCDQRAFGSQATVEPAQ